MPEQVKVGILRQIAILKKLREKFNTEEGIVVEIDETKEVLLKTYNPMNEIKVTTRQSESQKTQTPNQKKQPKTQAATPESRNFHRGKSRNLNFSRKDHGKPCNPKNGNFLYFYGNTVL